MTTHLDPQTLDDRVSPGQPNPATSGSDGSAPRWSSIAVVLAVAALAIGAVALWRSGPVEAATAIQQLEFDVAEDGTRFAFDEAPVYEDGLPAYGNAFVTQGYIYEAGAIAEGAGVTADGAPTHPDRVIGTWTCEGHMIGEGARTETGAWVVSKQIFDFADQPGAEQIISQGLELVDHEVAGQRPIVGGTGPYRNATGIHSQILHGHNDSEGVQLTMSLSVETPIEE